MPLPGARKLFQGVVVRMVYVPFGAGLLVPLLKRAAAGWCVLWSCPAGAVAR